MKKKYPFFIEDFILPHVHIYLDDIDEITRVLTDVSDKIIFENSEYEFESLKEINEKLGGKLKILTINGYKSGWKCIGVEIDNKDVRIKIHNASNQENYFGARFALNELLKKRTFWYSYLLKPFPWGFLSWITLLFLFPFDFIRENAVLSKMSIFTFVFSLSLFILSILLVWKGSTIYLDRRYKVSTFWERNRDGILSATIGGVIVLILQYIAKILFY